MMEETSGAVFRVIYFTLIRTDAGAKEVDSLTARLEKRGFKVAGKNRRKSLGSIHAVGQDLEFRFAKEKA